MCSIAPQEDLVSFAGGKTWYRWVNYVPPASGGLGGVLTSWQRRYSPAAPDKVREQHTLAVARTGAL